MRWIVHFGMAKTGTTAIQRGLADNAARLLGLGILYPESGQDHAHHILTSLIFPPEDVPRRIQRRMDDDPVLVRRKAEQVWSGIKRQIDRHRPAVTILSSEHFFQVDTDDARFRALLGEVSDDIEPWLYLRSPAARYLSWINQEARSCAEIDRPGPMKVRERIERIEAAFGTRMRLRPFEAAQLAEGDSLADFVRHALGGPEGLRDLRGARVNETVSAEAMSILSANRRVNMPGLDWAPMPNQTLLETTLREIETRRGRRAKPRLRAEVAGAVDAASTDLLWLRERYGLAFEAVDYTAVGPPLPPEIAALNRVEQVCEVDPELREALLFEALSGMLEAGVSIGALDRLIGVRKLVSARGRAIATLKAARRNVLGGLARAGTAPKSPGK